MKFDETISLKEMLDRAEREQATEIKRILPQKKGLTDVKFGFRNQTFCHNRNFGLGGEK